MPNVPIIDWSRLPHTNVPTKKVNRLEIRTKQRVKKKRKTKIKDKRLFNDIYDQDQHLRSI
jgi:hypothetical protein